MTWLAENVFAAQHSVPISYSTVLGAEANNKVMKDDVR
jgi:hypothetical protein